MPTRRAFLGSLSWPAVSLALPALSASGMGRALAAIAGGTAARPPEEIAVDEDIYG